jgi:uncharacterized protein (DUF1501 family)
MRFVAQCFDGLDIELGIMPTRRGFLRTGAGALSALTARASSRESYRAVVCIFLDGGNDGHNTVIPISTPAQGYAEYRQARGELALAEKSLFPIEMQSGSSREIYGLHPRLETVQRLFQQRRAAIVAGVGTPDRSPWRVDGISRDRSPEKFSARLDEIAETIADHSQRGPAREHFVCTLGGFDTHGAQLKIQDELLGVLDRAIAAFDAKIVELGVNGRVTLYTASDFGRAIVPNSTSGTDHGWANHHLVIGGPLPGGRLYGKFPLLLREPAAPAISADRYLALADGFLLY